MNVMHSPALKYSDGLLMKSQEMDSSIGHHQHQHQQQCHQQNYSGLLRYRSAPSSFLASFVDTNNNNRNTGSGCVNGDDTHQPYVPSTSSEMETMFSKLISSNNGWSNSNEHVQEEFGGGKQEEAGKQQNGYSYGSQLIYQSQHIHGLTNGSSGDNANGFDGSFGVVNSITSANSTQLKMGVRSCSNLIRQKSSQPGFFSNENGLAALREVGSFRASDVSNGEATASTTGLHGRSSSCLKRMAQITENENESIEGNGEKSGNRVNDNGSTKCHARNFINEFWEGSAFNSQKTENEEEIMFSTSNALESQDSDFCSQNLGLTHHLSLPTSSTKISSIEKFLRLQGTVPCKIRAKRGFATHPRSIAERVRRTRISERIKKLQGLFPKSDKQTSTADMLDLAVEYIKDLQEQVKILTDVRERCKCTSHLKQYS